MVANDSNGWICLHRQSLDSQVWQNSHLWKLWCYCLLKANHTNKEWIPIDGITLPVLVQRGQFITGRKKLHKEVYPKKEIDAPSALTLWRYLRKLEKVQNLNIKSTNKYTIVTVCNYERYQSLASNKTKGKSEVCSTTEQQLNTNNNDKPNKEYYEQSFGILWKVYPNKKGKDAALRWWLKNEPDETLLQTMLDAIDRQGQEKEQLKRADKFAPEWPHGSTWLNGKRWEDETLDLSTLDNDGFDDIPPIRTPSEDEIEFAQKLMAAGGVK